MDTNSSQLPRMQYHGVRYCRVSYAFPCFCENSWFKWKPAVTWTNRNHYRKYLRNHVLKTACLLSLLENSGFTWWTAHRPLHPHSTSSVDVASRAPSFPQAQHLLRDIHPSTLASLDLDASLNTQYPVCPLLLLSFSLAQNPVPLFVFTKDLIWSNVNPQASISGPAAALGWTLLLLPDSPLSFLGLYRLLAPWSLPYLTLPHSPRGLSFPGAWPSLYSSYLQP